MFVVSGGGRDFMRVFAEETWGIHKDNVIGMAAEYSYADGRIVQAEEVLGRLDVGPGKPEHIFAQTGRLPVFADVDIEMLAAPRFALLVNHDDEEREFAYTSGAEKSLAEAKELGWTEVSMKDDWNTVFVEGGVVILLGPHSYFLWTAVVTPTVVLFTSSSIADVPTTDTQWLVFTAIRLALILLASGVALGWARYQTGFTPVAAVESSSKNEPRMGRNAYSYQRSPTPASKRGPRSVTAASWTILIAVRRYTVNKKSSADAGYVQRGGVLA